MTAALLRVAKRIEREVGVSRATSYRIARKLNRLADTVDWGSSVPSERARPKPRKSRKKRK